MNTDERIARLKAELDAWQETAAQAARNCEYYRQLVIECGKALGEAAFRADDGVLHDSVLCAKVPELVRKLVSERNILFGQ